MNTFINRLFAPTLLCLALGLRAYAAEEGFQPIFNGKDLTGWDGDTRFWSVRDGAIVGQTTLSNPAPRNTFLTWTNGTPADFELRFSYKITANNDRSFGDSGFQYRSKQLPDFVVSGYQANLMVTKPLTGILYEEKGRGIIHQLGQKTVIKTDSANTNKHKLEVVGSFGTSEEIQASFKAGDWNDYVILAKGNHLQHFINGKQTADVTDEDPARAAKSGVLAVQLHAGPPMTVEFRNIHIKILSGGTASAAEEIKHMSGVWEIATSEADGAPIPADDSAGLTVTIDGEKYSVAKNGEIDRGDFSVNPAPTPKQMDIHPKTGNGAGKLIPAIYEFSSETLRVCYATEEGSKRPTAFSTSPDSGQVLITYKRKK